MVRNNDAAIYKCGHPLVIEKDVHTGDKVDFLLMPPQIPDIFDLLFTEVAMTLDEGCGGSVT